MGGTCSRSSRWAVPAGRANRVPRRPRGVPVSTSSASRCLRVRVSACAVQPCRLCQVKSFYRKCYHKLFSYPQGHLPKRRLVGRARRLAERRGAPLSPSTPIYAISLLSPPSPPLLLPFPLLFSSLPFRSLPFPSLPFSSLPFPFLPFPSLPSPSSTFFKLLQPSYRKLLTPIDQQFETNKKPPNPERRSRSANLNLEIRFETIRYQFILLTGHVHW